MIEADAAAGGTSGGGPLYPPLRPAPLLELPEGEIHLWAVRLDPVPAAVQSLGSLLDAEEWARAHRFRFERHRRRYVVGRGALRTLLGAYLDLAPELVRFRYGPRGKPFLAPPQEAAGTCFNLSNSDELALAGFVRRAEIGVDVELVRELSDLEAIAERFFSASERQELGALQRESKAEAFFNCWTRKEAYLKAVGEGLTAPLDSFDVTLAPGVPARMLALRGDVELAARWFYHHLRPAPGYIGAIAIEGGHWQVRTWTFPHGG